MQAIPGPGPREMGTCALKTVSHLGLCSGSGPIKVGQEAQQVDEESKRAPEPAPSLPMPLCTPLRSNSSTSESDSDSEGEESEALLNSPAKVNPTGPACFSKTGLGT